MRVGGRGITLALGGGGARGFAHVGVIQVLQDRGVPIDGVVGASAGALAGAGCALGYGADEMRQRVLEFTKSRLVNQREIRTLVERDATNHCGGLVDRVGRLYCQGRLVKSFLMDRSVIGARYFRDVVHFFLPEANIEDMPIPFACVATDINSGEAVVFDRGPLRPAVLASCSVPGVAPAVELDGRHLVDGGVACLIPTDVARDLGSQRVVAVNVDREVHCAELPGQALEWYLRAGDIQAWHLAQRLADLADLTIQPEVGEVHWADFARAPWIMNQGAVATASALPALLDLLRPPARHRGFLRRLWSPA